jgi:hypothetical protein
VPEPASKSGSVRRPGSIGRCPCRGAGRGGNT